MSQISKNLSRKLFYDMSRRSQWLHHIDEIIISRPVGALQSNEGARTVEVVNVTAGDDGTVW
jgi:hypothetical protein